MHMYMCVLFAWKFVHRKTLNSLFRLFLVIGKCYASLFDKELQKEIGQSRGENRDILESESGKCKYNMLNRILNTEKKCNIYNDYHVFLSFKISDMFKYFSHILLFRCQFVHTLLFMSSYAYIIQMQLFLLYAHP